jgi:hypothetical protein
MIHPFYLLQILILEVTTPQTRFTEDTIHKLRNLRETSGMSGMENDLPLYLIIE